MDGGPGFGSRSCGDENTLNESCSLKNLGESKEEVLDGDSGRHVDRYLVWLKLSYCVFFEVMRIGM
jgi:hypothetical protein